AAGRASPLVSSVSSPGQPPVPLIAREYLAARAASLPDLGGEPSRREAAPGQVAVRAQDVEHLRRRGALHPRAQRLEPAAQSGPALRAVELVGEAEDRLLLERDLALRAAADGTDDERAPERLVQLVLRNRDVTAADPRGRDPALDLPEPLEEVEPAAVCVRGFRGPGTPSRPWTRRRSRPAAARQRPSASRDRSSTCRGSRTSLRG